MLSALTRATVPLSRAWFQVRRPSCSKSLQKLFIAEKAVMRKLGGATVAERSEPETGSRAGKPTKECGCGRIQRGSQVGPPSPGERTNGPQASTGQPAGGTSVAQS